MLEIDDNLCFIRLTGTITLKSELLQPHRKYVSEHSFIWYVLHGKNESNFSIGFPDDL